MAWPAVVPTATWDRTSGTEGRQVDSVLHPMLCAKSQMLDSVKVGAQTDEPKIEWISAQTNARTVQGVSSSTTIHNSGSATDLALSSGLGATVKVGAILRNASKATGIGTYKVDELMLVTAISGDVLTLYRDYGANAAGTGFATHGTTSAYEVIFTGVEEGSSPSVNKYKPTVLDSNYTSILDFYLTVTGTELARRPQVAADNMQRQYEDRMIELKNDLSAFILYGAQAPANPAGTDANIRTTKGVLQALAQSGGNCDYTSTAVTEAGINKLCENILSAGCDRSETYKIFVHPAHARVISGFGADKVRVERVDKTWGRYVTYLLSDLGFELEVVPDPLVLKSNLFLLNMNKVELVPFRPWMQMEWGMQTSTPDGTDAYKKRILGEYTMRVIDPLKAHGCMTLLSWPT